MATSIITKDIIVDTVDLGSNTIASGAGADYTGTSVAKSGYKAIGIVGIRKTGTGQGACSVTRFSIDFANQKGVVTILNQSGASRTIQVSIDVLYARG